MSGRTLAISAIFYGEAVRFNRGKSRGDDYDFKYMRGIGNSIYPYVSGQSFKKHWRESLSIDAPPSPIIRPKNKAGKDKNQAYTAGNPIQYIDDDLFGYMIAGADPESDTGSADASDSLEEQSEDSALDMFGFRVGDFKNDGRDLLNFIRTDELIGGFIRSSADLAATLEALPKTTLDEGEQQTLADVLNSYLTDPRFISRLNERIGKNKPIKITKDNQKALDTGLVADVVRTNRTLIGEALKAHLAKEKADPTKRRTAPIRLHALVAFCGIKTAKDFQTMARDVALSGFNSVLNPSPVGIYSAWLKTRILIEGHRIGKFYVNEKGNLDLLGKEQGIENLSPEPEADPYSRGNNVSFRMMHENERQRRFSLAIRALANINNDHGPASGALHDGSLRPQGFIAAVMKCADSPFDFCWTEGENNTPYLNVSLLKNALRDYEDLFVNRRIYIGLPLNSEEGEASQVKAAIEAITDTEGRSLGFQAIVGTPRRILLQLADEATL